MKTTRLLIATLFLALGACAGAIDEPGGGDDNSADATDEPSDNTDEPTDEGGQPDAGGDEPGPSFAATVYPIFDSPVPGGCLEGCHGAGGIAVGVLDMSGGAESAFNNIMEKDGVVVPGNAAGSRLFNKPTGAAAHAGGDPLSEAKNPAGNAALKDWINGGANP